jgi:chromosome segregation ATPase
MIKDFSGKLKKKYNPKTMKKDIIKWVKENLTKEGRLKKKVNPIETNLIDKLNKNINNDIKAIGSNIFSIKKQIDYIKKQSKTLNNVITKAQSKKVKKAIKNLDETRKQLLEQINSKKMRKSATPSQIANLEKQFKKLVRSMTFIRTRFQHGRPREPVHQPHLHLTIR